MRLLIDPFRRIKLRRHSTWIWNDWSVRKIRKTFSRPRFLLVVDYDLHAFQRRLVRVFVAVPQYSGSDEEHYDGSKYEADDMDCVRTAADSNAADARQRNDPDQR